MILPPTDSSKCNTFNDSLSDVAYKGASVFKHNSFSEKRSKTSLLRNLNNISDKKQLRAD